MSRNLIALSLTTFLAAATMLSAQDTTETEPAAPAAEPAVNDALDMGQPVATSPALGQRYVKEAYGDWNLACVKTDAETDPCSLVQVLLDQTGNAVAEVSMFRISEGQAVAGATMIVPLETFLPAQLTIAVDGGAGKRYNYQFCNQVGCVAQIGLTQGDIDAFKRGNAATVSLVPAQAPDQVITLTMSLTGFTAGYDVVDVVTK